MGKKRSLCVWLCVILNVVEGHINLAWDPPTAAFDAELYERVLDPQECSRQLSFLTTNSTLLLARFLDAGIRLPKGIFIGNNVHLGNYHQCLGIAQDVQDMSIEGKYCMISVPGNQTLQLPNTETWTQFDPTKLLMDEQVAAQLEELNQRRLGFRNMFAADLDDSRNLPGNPIARSTFRLALCVPKPCTTNEFMDGLLFNLTAVGFQYRDDFCRLNDDKPWSAADTVAVVVFSLIGLLVLSSTSYDLWQTKLLRKDPKSVNTILKSFSVYTNTQRLMNFPSGPNVIQCLDGVRALAMLWVLVGHSFISQPLVYNNIDLFQWITSARSLWVQAGHLTVDTFFFLSGLLVVYTTAGKLTSMKLLKNLHLFYLNRLLRIFPILATAVLLEASLLHRLLDGPAWRSVASHASRCRAFWWAALLHVQNYVNPERVCVSVTWYLSIDVQLHILSPIVLVWVLSGNNKFAWTALTTALLGVITAAAVYCFQNDFPAGMVANQNTIFYFVYYYINTLTRASPFMVGMVYGYILHIWRNSRVKIPALLNVFLWLVSFALLGLTGYAVLPTVQLDWDNQLATNFYNSFLRPTWALALGWVVFACAKGYGGPVNWFLSLQMWKLPARLSYAMYLFHFSLMTVVNSSRIQPIWFSVEYIVFLFFAYAMLTFIISFVATVAIDSPMTVFVKLLLDRGEPKNKTVTVSTTPEIRFPYRVSGLYQQNNFKRNRNN